MLARIWRKGNSCTLLIEMFPTVENMEIPQKLKTELRYDPASLPLGIYPKEIRSSYQKDHCTTMFVAALFTKAQRNATRFTTEENEARGVQSHKARRKGLGFETDLFPRH
jgi:hypothetical protein